VFRRDGDFWTLVYEGTMVLVRGNKGFHHIACLLAMPGREYAVQDLALDAESEMGSLAAADAGHQDLGSEVTTSLGDAGPALDGRAKAEYRRRLTELNQELEQAERNNDPGGAERARAEIDFLMQQISSAVGLAGRDRPTGSHNERARILVTQRIRTAIKRISESHPSLGDHLTASLHTGYRCVYRPPGDLPITWRT
jgi:hypothetical protein